MKSTKTLKVNIQQNILRQIIFTNRNIILVFSFVILFPFWYFFKALNIHIKFIVSLIFSSAIFLSLTVKIEEQNLYSLLFDIIKYIFRNKKEIF